MAEIRQLRTFSIGKARNLWRTAQVAMRDARAPAQYISAGRRFDAAYDAGLSCALLLAECEKVDITGAGHHVETPKRMSHTLALKGQTAEVIPAMIQARNAARYDAEPVANEAVVEAAIEWADRILAETEGWLQQHQPNALK